MQITQKTEFSSFEKALSMSPHEVIEKVKKSGLKGRGGANFPTGLKWECTRNCPNPQKIMICNADEGEPGTFKDRYIIQKNPETLIEGLAIAGYATGANIALIYLRGEYEYLKEILEETIQKYAYSLTRANIRIEVILGAGAYICGDETAIMSSIQELRGEPHAKPPYPAEKGLCDCPTCINNVETLTNIPLIIKGQWKDLRLFSISGDVAKPGVYESHSGVKASVLLKRASPKKLKALFFGCAGGCVQYSPELILNTEKIKELGAMLGSCSIIAVGSSQSIPKICRNITEFFVHESCGKCTPCREGNLRVLQILDRIIQKKATKQDIGCLEDLANIINSTSLCGLGQASNTHIKTALRYFRKEFVK